MSHCAMLMALEHARFGSAPGRVRDLIEEVLPQALDVGRILPQDHMGVGFETATCASWPAPE